MPNLSNHILERVEKAGSSVGSDEGLSGGIQQLIKDNLPRDEPPARTLYPDCRDPLKAVGYSTRPPFRVIQVSRTTPLTKARSLMQLRKGGAVVIEAFITMDYYVWYVTLLQKE